MKTIRMSVLTTCVVLLTGVVHADIVAIQHTMDYRNNDWLNDIWFAEPGAILDHIPFCRNCLEDWGWTHVVTNRIPAGATGIESATVTIIAWKIDVEQGEDDIIYALPEQPATTTNIPKTGTKLGMLNSYMTSPIAVVWSSNGQINNYEKLWSTTTFDLPANTIDDLWTNGQVYFHIDIDQTNADGMRATLESAVLRINYIAPKPPTPPMFDVHRFWSPVLCGHFYTTNEEEMQWLIDNYPHVWTYEGIAYRAMVDDTDPMAVPVHRFWSPVFGTHFYTINENEVDNLIVNYPYFWIYEGPMFYAYPTDYQPADTDRKSVV